MHDDADRRPRSQSQDLRPWLESFVLEAGFLSRYPYYAHVLAGLEPVADPSVPAMGVSLHGSPGRGGRYFLHVNVERFRREPQFLRGILLHEVHHIVLGHLAHPKFFGAAHPDLMALAQEMSANEHIDEALPSPMLWQHLERYGMRAGQSTLERYARLCAARAEGAGPFAKSNTEFIDDHHWREQLTPPPGGVQQTRQLIERAREQGAEDAERASAGRAKSATMAGLSPEQLLIQLVGTTDAPQVYIDWRAALRAFVAQARAPVHTWSRPSRRFPKRVGELPGRSYQLRDVLRPTLVLAIDTSLSMSAGELAEIARQLRPISELARLVIVECDAAITRVYPFTGTLESVKGRGGTDLRPVFDKRFLRAQGANGVVYFTDGAGPYPQFAPSIPTLWMLTKPIEFECPWGMRAILEFAPSTSRVK